MGVSAGFAVRVFAASAVLGLVGCASVGGSAEMSIFDLAVPSDFSDIKARSAAQLLVPKPSTSEALATERIVVRQANGELSYLPKVSWSDELPALVQTSLLRSFENSGKVKAVGRPGESLAIDDQVIVDVRAFELDVTGAPTARVSLGVKLLDDRNGKVRATRVFTEAVPAASDGSADAIAALNKAADSVLREIVGWTATAL